MAGSWLRVPIHGGATLIDLADLAVVAAQSWHVSDTGYAVRRKGSPRRTFRLHRLIAGTPNGLVTDHINHDRLDNRRNNLRICTQQSNARNRRLPARGYTWDAAKGRWLVRFRDQFYGRYSTEEEAARAYQLARSGVVYAKTSRKLRYLPFGITKQFGKYQVRPQRQGVRHYVGAFSRLEDAMRALEDFNRKGQYN